jgi:cation:H+ antiporter
LSSYLLLLLSFPLLLGGAVLFTNAVEWLGHELRLGQGAVGSILAAVGTALPESLIPVVALIGGAEGGGDVAVGAIVGAPFLLATIALALVGASAFLFRRRRRHGVAIDADLKTIRRDLLAFVVLFVVAIGLGLGAPRPLQLAGAVALVLAYAFYVYRTVSAPSSVADEHSLDPLFADTTRHDPPNRLQIVGQLVLGLGAIVGGAHLFVEEVLHVAESAGVTPLVLALVLAPFATELPEKANSFLWMRQGKDTLALGNVTGAMVFQSTLPVAFGLAFTDWQLGTPSLLAAGLGLAGAVLAYLVIARRRFGPLPILVWAGLYAAFVVFVAAGGG